MFLSQEAAVRLSSSALVFSLSPTHTLYTTVTSCHAFRPEGQRVTQLYMLRIHCRHAQWLQQPLFSSLSLKCTHSQAFVKYIPVHHQILSLTLPLNGTDRQAGHHKERRGCFNPDNDRGLCPLLWPAGLSTSGMKWVKTPRSTFQHRLLRYFSTY